VETVRAFTNAYEAQQRLNTYRAFLERQKQMDALLTALTQGIQHTINSHTSTETEQSTQDTPLTSKIETSPTEKNTFPQLLNPNTDTPADWLAVLEAVKQAQTQVHSLLRPEALAKEAAYQREFLTALEQLEAYTFISYDSKKTDLRFQPIPPQAVQALVEKPIEQSPAQRLINEEVALKQNELAWLQRQRFAPEVRANTTLNFAGSNPVNPASALGQLRPTSVNTNVSVNIPIIDRRSQRLSEEEARLELEALRLQQEEKTLEARRQKAKWKRTAQTATQPTEAIQQEALELGWHKTMEALQTELSRCSTSETQGKRPQAYVIQEHLSQIHTYEEQLQEDDEQQQRIHKAQLDLWVLYLQYKD
jgi:hypothetical protein